MSEENEWLAIEVMGWRRGTKQDAVCDATPQYVDPQGDKIYLYVLGWNPRENIEQAFMLLDKFDDVEIYREEDIDGWVAWFANINHSGTFHSNESPSVAIVNAVLSASGYQPIKQGG